MGQHPKAPQERLVARMAFDLAPPTGEPMRPSFDASSGVVDEAAIAAIEADGVVCLRNFLAASEMPAIHEGCNEALRAPTSQAQSIGDDGGPSFFYDFNVSDRIEAFRRLRDDTAMADIAMQLMRSSTVVRYFDNLFIKDAGGGAASPWHEDASFQRVTGRDSVNFWVAFDPVPRQTALQYLAGSHLRDEPIYLMGHFDDGDDYDGIVTRNRVPSRPVEELGAEYERVWWDLEPGDALVWFHRTLHGAPANTLPISRRAIAYIWVGDDAYYDASPGYIDPDFVDPNLADGNRFVSQRFPKVRG